MTGINKLIEVLQIINKYDPDCHFLPEHEQMYVGDYAAVMENATDAEKARLEELGVFEDEDSLSFFC